MKKYCLIISFLFIILLHAGDEEEAAGSSTDLDGIRLSDVLHAQAEREKKREKKEPPPPAVPASALVKQEKGLGVKIYTGLWRCIRGACCLPPKKDRQEHKTLEEVHRCCGDCSGGAGLFACCTGACCLGGAGGAMYLGEPTTAIALGVAGSANVAEGAALLANSGAHYGLLYQLKAETKKEEVKKDK